MPTVAIKAVKPSRKGNAIILVTTAGEIFLTKEEFASKPVASESVDFEVKESYFRADGTEVKYPEGKRLIFAGFPLESRMKLLREKMELAQEFGLSLAV
jgi:hypothetical protein